jgi:prepilin-type processing-associated H-X9-DG protein
VGKQQVLGWAYQILPYIEQNTLWADANEDVAKGTPVKTYFCPSRRDSVVLTNSLPAPKLNGPRAGIDYFGNMGPTTGANEKNGMILKNNQAPITFNLVTDGTSNTMVVAERCMLPGWYRSTSTGGETDVWRGGYTAGWSRYASVHACTAAPIPDQGANSAAGFNNFGSPHPGGINAVFADGSVRTIRYQVDPAVFKSSCQRNDGTVLNLDDL